MAELVLESNTKKLHERDKQLKTREDIFKSTHGRQKPYANSLAQDEGLRIRNTMDEECESIALDNSQILFPSLLTGGMTSLPTPLIRSLAHNDCRSVNSNYQSQWRTVTMLPRIQELKRKKSFSKNVLIRNRTKRKEHFMQEMQVHHKSIETNGGLQAGRSINSFSSAKQYKSTKTKREPYKTHRFKVENNNINSKKKKSW